MKKICAFLIALLLFAGSVTGIHFATYNDIPAYSLSYGTWINASKFSCTQGLQKLFQDQEAIPVFGSSELRHGQKSGFHCNSVFKGSDMKPVFIGAAGYQSLVHAIALGATAESIKGKKVVLVVSPQWFKKDGTSSNAFGSAFSEDNFISLLENQKLSSDTRDYIIKRAEELTAENEGMSNKIAEDLKWYSVGTDGSTCSLSWLSEVKKNLNYMLVQEKSRSRLLIECGTLQKTLGKLKTVPVYASVNKDRSPDWSKLRQCAEKRGENLSTNNAYGMYDKVYNSMYKSIVNSNNPKKVSYTTSSPEFGDLECFLKVCKDTGIEPLLVLQPFNGYWYDFQGLDADARQALYDKVLKLAEQYGVKCADMSSNEYSKYYFEDNSHLALNGLVDFDEEIYRFYKNV